MWGRLSKSRGLGGRLFFQRVSIDNRYLISSLNNCTYKTKNKKTRNAYMKIFLPWDQWNFFFVTANLHFRILTYLIEYFLCIISCFHCPCPCGLPLYTASSIGLFLLLQGSLTCFRCGCKHRGCVIHIPISTHLNRYRKRIIQYIQFHILTSYKIKSHNKNFSHVK